MFKEYEIVKASKDLNNKVLKGCKGTVLIVFNSVPTAYVVEFVDESNETIDVLTVENYEIVK